MKSYTYVKARDEIVPAQMSSKEQKDRHVAAVAQVALRTLHEVFETDRVGRIHSIALIVDVEHLDPATGRATSFPLVVVAADRQTFTEFDLSHVVPSATLARLGAAISKNPFDLVPPDTSRGVRVRGR